MNSFRNSMLSASIKYKNGDGYIVNSVTVATKSYVKRDKYYSHKGWYICDWFEITENVGGDIFIETHTKMKHSGVVYTNTIKFNKGEVDGMKIDTISNY